MDQEEADKQAAADKQTAAEAMQAALGKGGAGDAGDDAGADNGDDADTPKPPAALTRGRGSDRAGMGGGDGKRRAPRSLALVDAPALPYRTPEYSAWEMAVVRPEIVGRDLDVETARTAGEVQDVLRKIDLMLALATVALANRGLAGMTAGLAKLAVSASLTKQLRTAMERAAVRARDYGDRAVRSEIARQALPVGIGPGPAPTIPGAVVPVEPMAPAPDPAAMREARDAVLSAEVDRAVADEIGRRESAARTAARDAIASAGARDSGELAAVAGARAEARLQELSPARTESNVAGVVNSAFGAGRQDGVGKFEDDNPGRIRAKVYTAVMDGGTCPECAKWDGAEFPVDFPEDVTGVQCPNPKCEGGYGRCRCAWIYVLNDESTPSLPASKGPERG